MDQTFSLTKGQRLICSSVDQEKGNIHFSVRKKDKTGLDITEKVPFKISVNSPVLEDYLKQRMAKSKSK